MTNGLVHILIFDKTAISQKEIVFFFLIYTAEWLKKSKLLSNI